MASGRQIAEESVKTFAAWIASKNDDDFRAIAVRGVLSRKEIAIECAFAKSTLDQNPRVKAALKELEVTLRERGVLPLPVAVTLAENERPSAREPGRLRDTQDAERLRRLETDNASLKAEVSELKRLLAKHSILSEALALTGRLPR